MRSPSRSAWFAVYASTISFGFRLLIAATLARGGWLNPLRAHRDLHPVRSTKLAWRTNGNGISRAQVMPTGQDDNHVQYHSLKGARVGVGWMPRVRPVHSKLRHKAREMSGKGRVIFDNCVSM